MPTLEDQPTERGTRSVKSETRRKVVAVVGDASIPSGSPKDVLAEEIGRALVDAGYRVMTGGLGGVMESACRGAKSSARYAQGDTIGILPGHDPAEANPYIDIAIPSGLNHVRNSVVAHADAMIAIGGGAGTMSEICLAWAYKRLIIAMRVDGWSGRVAGQRIDDRIRYPGEPDDQVFGADSAEQALALLASRLPGYVAQHRGVRHRH